MKMDWKCVAVIMVAMMLGASLIAPVALAKGEGLRIHSNDLDRWQGGILGGFYGDNYHAYVQPLASTVYVSDNFGGDQGACYQACVNSGEYSRAECGQMCYYPL